jgi:pimeloyl-ACP methyl ester carboxylesterase
MDPRRIDLAAADGTQVRLWEVSDGSANEAVLFVHGATYPGRAVFAPPGEREYSWLHAAARRGRAAFAVDLRGYGESELPARADESTVPARAEDVAGDVAAALEAIRERFERVHLVGYSWGSIVCGYYLTTVEDDVASLAQVAPVYRPQSTVRDRLAGSDPIDPVRRITRADVRERWNEGIPSDADPVAWRGGEDGDDPVLDAFWQAVVSSNHRLEGADPPTVAVPNGTILDLRAAADGEPVYRADGIPVPTLVVRGSLDDTAMRDDGLRLYDELTGAPTREYAEIGGGTHFLPLERRRRALYDAVDGYQDRAVSDDG